MRVLTLAGRPSRSFVAALLCTHRRLRVGVTKGALALAGGSGAGGAGLQLPRLVLSSFKQPEAEPFLDVRFKGLEVCAELHGEEMDGVLASMALEDLGVYEVRLARSPVAGVCENARNYVPPQCGGRCRICLCWWSWWSWWLVLLLLLLRFLLQ